MYQSLFALFRAERNADSELCSVRVTSDPDLAPFRIKHSILCYTGQCQHHFIIIIMLINILSILMLIIIQFPMPWFHLQRCYLSCLLRACLAVLLLWQASHVIIIFQYFHHLLKDAQVEYASHNNNDIAIFPSHSISSDNSSIILFIHINLVHIIIISDYFTYPLVSILYYYFSSTFFCCIYFVLLA